MLGLMLGLGMAWLQNRTKSSLETRDTAPITR